MRGRYSSSVRPEYSGRAAGVLEQREALGDVEPGPGSLQGEHLVFCCLYVAFVPHHLQEFNWRVQQLGPDCRLVTALEVLNLLACNVPKF